MVKNQEPIFLTDKGPLAISGVKLFTKKQIGISTFFATPLAGLLMLILNFKQLGKRREELKATVLAIIILPPLCYVLNEMLEKKWYRLLAFVFAGVMMYIAEERQNNDNGTTTEPRSIWATFVIIILSLMIITVSLIIYGFY